MIKVRSIYLKNFKIHREKSLNFEDKNLIIGENGTGKSSVFHAIIYGLFGSSSREYINISRTSSLVREFSTEAKVIIKLNDGKENYIIERVIRRDGSSLAVLRKNDIIIATSPDIVRKKILDVLNINRENKILDILYIPQGELGKYIKSSGKKELTELLEKIFDLDYYSTMLEAIKRVIKDLITEQDFISSRIYQKERDILKFSKIYGNKSIEELEEIAKKYNELYAEYKRLKEGYLKIKALLENVDYKLIEEKEKLQQEEKELESEIREYEEILTNLKAELKSLKYKEIDENLIKKGVEELEELKKGLKEFENLSKKDIEKEIEKYNEIMMLINKYESLRDIDKEYEILLKKMEDKKVELQFVRSKIYELKDAIRLLRKERENRCPVCGKVLSQDEIELLIKNKSKELHEYETKKVNLEKEVYTLENKVRKLRFKIEEYNSIINLLKGKNIDLSRIEEEKIKIFKKISELKEILSKIELCEKVNDAINYLKEKEIRRSIEYINKVYYDLKKKYDDVLKKIRKIEIMEKYTRQANEILNNLGYNSISGLEADLKNLEAELEKYQGINIREIELYKIHLKELDELKEKLKKIKKNISNLNTLKTILERFILQYRKTVARKLSVAFNYYFKKLYRYGDIKEVKVELKYERQEWKFYLYVKKNIDDKEFWREVREANLSGGQIKILDLAFRLALAHIVKPNFKVLLLDEPTESLDENIRLALAELLDSLKDYQIILCTHDELFKEKIQGKVFEFRRS